MKKILMVLAVVTVLFGCSAKVEQKKFAGSSNGVKIEVQIEHSKDKVLKQTSKSTVEFEKLGLDKDKMIELVETYKEKYKVKGVEYQSEVSKGSLTETIQIDYEEADLKELIESGLILSNKEGELKYVSYEETVKNLEASGLKEQ